MAHIFTPALRRPLSKPFARSGTRTLIQRAIASLRARGSDAHLWLPGVGTVNSITTGNYLESTGNTVATVDNPTGLVLDALGSVGSDILNGTGAFDSATGWSKPAAASITGGKLVCAAANGYVYRTGATVVSGTTYKITIVISAYTSGTLRGYVNATASFSNNVSGVGIFDVYVVAGSTSGEVGLNLSTFTGDIESVTICPTTGIHLTQSTTANKGLLKQDAGSRYYWLFDATDLLTGTFPAGYESVTVIDAKSTGQVTTSAANVVGSYSIGPSYSSYGRIIIKGSITASELALYQGFANKLAGL